MHRDIEWISPRASVREAAEKMRAKKVGALLVREWGKDVGIVSEADFVRKVVALGKNPDEAQVQEIMSYPLISIDIDQNAQDANDLMAEKRIRHLFVTQKGEVVGILSVRDLVLFFKNRL
jgi:CBS domain-containing protein